MKYIHLQYLVFFALLYIYIYNPIFQFIDFGLIKVLLILALIYIILSRKTSMFISFFSKELFFTVILITYSMLAALRGDGTAYNIPYKHTIWFLEGFIIPFFLFFAFRNVFQKKSLEVIIVNLGFGASLLTLFLILNPNINLIIRDTIIRDSLSSLVSSNIIIRGFTIAENSTYSYGIIQGLILAICIFMMQKNLIYTVPIIFLFISILFNARIGFIPPLIALGITLTRWKIRLKHILLITTVVLLGNYLLIKSNFAEKNSESLKWGFEFFEDTYNFFKGQDRIYSNYSVLKNNMIQFPDKFIHLIFGEGKTIFGTNRGSDIGYINQIFTGGITYIILMLLFLFYMYVRYLKNYSNKYIVIIFFVSILIVNIKGDAFFVPNGFFRLLVFSYVYSIMSTKLNKYALL